MFWGCWRWGCFWVKDFDLKVMYWEILWVGWVIFVLLFWNSRWLWLILILLVGFYLVIRVEFWWGKIVYKGGYIFGGLLIENSW